MRRINEIRVIKFPHSAVAPPPHDRLANGTSVEYTSVVLALCLIVASIQNYLVASFGRLNALAGSLALEARVTACGWSAMGLSKFAALVLGN